MTLSEIMTDDYDEMIALWKSDPNIRLSKADSREGISYFLNRNKGLNFKLVHDGRIAGTILCGNDGRRGYFHHLFIGTDFRGKGYGSLLVQKCVGVLVKEGITKIHIFVLPGNTGGQMFWEKNGFYRRTQEEILFYSKDI